MRAAQAGLIQFPFDMKAFTRRAIASIPRRNPLVEVIGDFHDTAGLVEWLDISKQALAKRVQKAQVLGCQTGDGHWVYPAWQFNDRGDIYPGIAEATGVLLQRRDAWAVAHWFAVPSPDLPGAVSAATWLAQGGDPTPVIDEAVRDTDRLAS